MIYITRTNKYLLLNKNQKNNKWKITFKIQYNYFKYQVIFFCLLNVLTSFQDYINKIYAKKFNVFIIFCPNNTFIYDKNISIDYVIVI